MIRHRFTATAMQSHLQCGMSYPLRSQSGPDTKVHQKWLPFAKAKSQLVAQTLSEPPAFIVPG